MPVQFEPDALRTSVGHMLTHEPQIMPLTHYKRVDHSTTEVRTLAQHLLGLVNSMTAIALKLCAAPDRHQPLKSLRLAGHPSRRPDTPPYPPRHARP